MEIAERRFNTRAEASASGRVVRGYAARFNTRSQDLGGWKERLVRGCFRDTLADGHPIRMYHSHDPARILGSTQGRDAASGASTLALNEDASGLAFRCALPRNADGDSVLESVRRGDLTSMSFGFRCIDSDWQDEDDDPDNLDRSRRGKKISVRHVKKLHLIEVSSVAEPAYLATSIAPAAEMVAAAAAGARSLFPGGIVPAEIRSRVPGFFAIDAEQQEQDARARQFLTRLARLS
jgi:HK97 family phage prohead protease